MTNKMNNISTSRYGYINTEYRPLINDVSKYMSACACNVRGDGYINMYRHYTPRECAACTRRLCEWSRHMSGVV